MMPAIAKDRITAGPALAAPTPVRVRMPVPTIAPTPSAIRCGQPSERLSRCSGASSSSDTIVLRAFHLATRPSPFRGPHIGRFSRRAARWKVELRHALADEIAGWRVTADQEVPALRAVHGAADKGRRAPDHLGVVGHVAPVAATADVRKGAGAEQALFLGPAVGHLLDAVRAPRPHPQILALARPRLGRRMGEASAPRELGAVGGGGRSEARVPD